MKKSMMLIALLLLSLFIWGCSGLQKPYPSVAPSILPSKTYAENSPTATVTVIPAVTPSPSPSAVPTETPATVSATPSPAASADPLPYYVYAEKGSHTITVYGKDAQGNYTVVVKSFLTATGKTVSRTPTGKFKLGSRQRWHHFAGEDAANYYAQYATNFYGNLYIHSSLYSWKAIDRLLPQYYNQIGQNVTAGCLRTSAYAAWWIYTNCPPGTTLEIVNGSPKGTKAAKPPAAMPAKGKWQYYDPSDPLRPGFTEPPN